MAPQKEEETQLAHNTDEVDYPPNNCIYRWIDAFIVIFSIFTYLLDWVFDVLTAYSHWQHRDEVWFSFTVVFISVPSLAMTGVSLHWYIKDADNPSVPRASMSKWVVRLVMLLLQLGPIMRYLESLRYGLLSRRYGKEGDRKRQVEYYTYMLYEDGDSVFLRMFECFMEAAPQLVLQLYILTLARDLEYGSSWVYMLSIGCFTSLVSLAWGVTAYARGSRFTSLTKPNISIAGSAVMFLWHLFSIVARVVAMVLFASEFKLYLFVFCGFHWLIMVLWLMVRRSLTSACSNFLGELGFSFVLGVIYIFVFLNEKEEPTRWKYAWYYTICGVENALMVLVWLTFADPSLWFYIPGVVVHFVSFLLGLAFMGLYYAFLHPSGPKGEEEAPGRRQQVPKDELEVEEVKRELEPLGDTVL